jgi:hypothetical protein
MQYKNKTTTFPDFLLITFILVSVTGKIQLARRASTLKF